MFLPVGSQIENGLFKGNHMLKTEWKGYTKYRKYSTTHREMGLMTAAKHSYILMYLLERTLREVSLAFGGDWIMRLVIFKSEWRFRTL